MALRRHMIGGLPRDVRDAGLVVMGVFADDGALERARAWARDVLARRRLDAERSPLRASRALRAEDPRLTLAAARWLVAHLEEDPGGAPERGPRPGRLH
ncbi:hypothetical protein [Brachybacterium kimchii]|uniref:Uncharacterized protein n=1 Tax=Brachybacterium kimchii TaxID=2942909 RepID=A0ABY4NBW1_9MICO|nr:hypothetical protein [Brachybacterium kimchii]UQN30968.1 hypothetical protein M4486_06640 [Brachybacterium kimchii]